MNMNLSKPSVTYDNTLLHVLSTEYSFLYLLCINFSFSTVDDVLLSTKNILLIIILKQLVILCLIVNLSKRKR